MKIGYARFSSKDQNPDRQLDRVEVERMFVDFESGVILKREQLTNMINFVREGDPVFVHSLCRLLRNFQNLQKILDTLN